MATGKGTHQTSETALLRLIAEQNPETISQIEIMCELLKLSPEQAVRFMCNEFWDNMGYKMVAEAEAGNA